MEDEQELIQSLRQLSINQQRLIKEVVAQLVAQERTSGTEAVDRQPRTVRGSTLGTNHGIRRLPRATNQQFLDVDGKALALGDRVELLNSRRTGKTGDIGEVTKFNHSFVAFRVLRTGTIGQRASFNLRFIE